jgi:hypothetical protein
VWELLITKRDLAAIVIDGRQWPDEPVALAQRALHQWLDQARNSGVQGSGTQAEGHGNNREQKGGYS